MMGCMPMSPFVAKLRSMVGHELLQLPSVTALCRDESGRILLVKEADSGRWSTPGGAIEPGENPEQAAIREVAEETSLTIVIDRLRTALGGPDYRTVYSNGDQLSFISIVYDASVVAGVPTPDSDETTEVAWFSLEELLSLPLTNFVTLLLRDGILPRLMWLSCTCATPSPLIRCRGQPMMFRGKRSTFPTSVRSRGGQ
jgi:8-oxo-dGTP pyrophosphatase MutT (NUDIX family)